MSPSASDPRALGAIQEMIRAKFKTLLKTRTLRGYPLNMSFTDVDDVTRKVCTLCIELCGYIYVYMCWCAVLIYVCDVCR